jgi:hypothetical protein
MRNEWRFNCAASSRRRLLRFIRRSSSDNLSRFTANGLATLRLSSIASLAQSLSPWLHHRGSDSEGSRRH